VLVLSRRADETIVFPSVGITVRLLRIEGRVAKIGIDAPAGIRVLRQEVAHAPPPAARPVPRSPAHELCNRLSKVSLGLHLFERQREAGRHAEAEATLARVFDALAALDRDSVTALIAGRAPARAAPAPTRGPARALLVEDDPNERELLAGVLRMQGCECATAADGADALAYLRSHERPDVVLLDMHMPRCDGPTALRAIRAESRLSGLRVFGVSGSDPRELGIATGAGGVDGWFPKPLDPRSLWDAIRSCTPAGYN